MLATPSKDISFASTTSGSFKDVPTPFISPPMVTAMSWSITEGENGILLWGKDANERMEIASLTKVMTAYATLRMLRLLKLEHYSTIFEVSPKATQTIGTIANLVSGDKLKVTDLLYGLLLPSGNDAAICLAEGCGKLIIDAWCKNKLLKNKIKKILNMISAKDITGINPIELFVRYMNRISTKLGLTKSTFSNPTGLADKANKSTATDIGKLVHTAKKETLISMIVRTKEYKCKAGTANPAVSRDYCWTNTNLLLNEGYDGFKTGVTPTAGPCLIGTKTYRNIELIITVLHCKTCEYRYKEVNAIFNWASTVIDSIYSNSDEEINLKKLAILFHKAL